MLMLSASTNYKNEDCLTAHSLRMNSSTFSAFQMSGTPEVSTTNRKHLKMKKSMKLPDDTLEYWGFFLPHGSTVTLSVCARWDGAHILVVNGEKVLNNCGSMGTTVTGDAPHMAQGRGQVQVTYEGAAQEIMHSDSTAFRLQMNKEHAEHLRDENLGGEITDDNPDGPSLTTPKTVLEGRKQRHQRTRRKHHRDNGTEQNSETPTLHRRRRSLEVELNSQEISRHKRMAEAVPKHKLDGGIAHGGNAINFTDKNNDSSISSFENNLLTCHDGKILLHKEFAPSDLCTSKYLENGTLLQTTHQVLKDGYYYYIFYSDNDFHPNDIHTIFDIYKPTYQYGNYSNGCINVTECTFPITMFSDDMVVVEVPTRDGIEHESDDITQLISTCHPRTSVYAIFPVAVLFLILGCAFL